MPYALQCIFSVSVVLAAATAFGTVINSLWLDTITRAMEVAPVTEAVLNVAL